MSKAVKYVTAVHLGPTNAASEAPSRSRSTSRKDGAGDGGGRADSRLGLPPRSAGAAAAAGRSVSRSKSPMRNALPTRLPTPPKDAPATPPVPTRLSPRPLRAARHLSPSKFGGNEREAVPKPSVAIFSRNLAQSRYATQPSSAPNSPKIGHRGLPRFDIRGADDDDDDGGGGGGRARYDRSASIGVVVPHRASVVLSRSPSPSPANAPRRSSIKVADKLSERLVALSPAGTRKYEKSDGSSSYSPSATRKTSGYGGVGTAHSSNYSPSAARNKPGSGRKEEQGEERTAATCGSIHPQTHRGHSVLVVFAD